MSSQKFNDLLLQESTITNKKGDLVMDGNHYANFSKVGRILTYVATSTLSGADLRDMKVIRITPAAISTLTFPSAAAYVAAIKNKTYDGLYTKRIEIKVEANPGVLLAFGAGVTVSPIIAALFPPGLGCTTLGTYTFFVQVTNNGVGTEAVTIF